MLIRLCVLIFKNLILIRQLLKLSLIFLFQRGPIFFYINDIFLKILNLSFQNSFFWLGFFMLFRLIFILIFLWYSRLTQLFLWYLVNQYRLLYLLIRFSSTSLWIYLFNHFFLLKILMLHTNILSLLFLCNLFHK